MSLFFAMIFVNIFSIIVLDLLFCLDNILIFLCYDSPIFGHELVYYGLDVQGSALGINFITQILFYWEGTLYNNFEIRRNGKELVFNQPIECPNFD